MHHHHVNTAGRRLSAQDVEEIAERLDPRPVRRPNAGRKETRS